MSTIPVPRTENTMDVLCVFETSGTNHSSLKTNTVSSSSSCHGSSAVVNSRDVLDQTCKYLCLFEKIILPR